MLSRGLQMVSLEVVWAKNGPLGLKLQLWNLRHSSGLWTACDDASSAQPLAHPEVREIKRNDGTFSAFALLDF